MYIWTFEKSTNLLGMSIPQISIFKAFFQPLKISFQNFFIHVNQTPFRKKFIFSFLVTLI